MFLPGTYMAALVMMLLGMFFWGSWPNTYKLTTGWRFELFYWDCNLNGRTHSHSPWRPATQSDISRRMIEKDTAPGSGCPRVRSPSRLARPTRHTICAVPRAATSAALAAALSVSARLASVRSHSTDRRAASTASRIVLSPVLTLPPAAAQVDIADNNLPSAGASNRSTPFNVWLALI